jgi:hypothetical protein
MGEMTNFGSQSDLEQANLDLAYAGWVLNNQNRDFSYCSRCGDADGAR